MAAVVVVLSLDLSRLGVYTVQSGGFGHTAVFLTGLDSFLGGYSLSRHSCYALHVSLAYIIYVAYVVSQELKSSGILIS